MLAVTVGAIQAADVEPAPNVAIPAPGDGEAEGVQVSQAMP